MIDLKSLEKEEYFNEYKTSLTNRGGDVALLENIRSMNQERKKAITAAETKKAEQNKASQEIAILKKEKKDATEKLVYLKKLSDEIKELDLNRAKIEEEIQNKLATLPNKLNNDVPKGNSEKDNKEIEKWGEPRKFSFKPKEHFEIGEKLKILDFERAGKIAGARFAILNGLGAKLERAIIQFMLDEQIKAGYTETIPPYIANSATFFGTGQFPKFKDDVFHLEGTDYHLIPTAEVPVTNYFRDEILKEEELPISLTAFTPCFRSEAGSYGKDTKGLIRQHQFHKVELIKITSQQQSYDQHEEMAKNAANILRKLKLPYRKMSLCSKDIGFASAKTYDFEVWLPGQDAYREISSVSNCESFQARRANIRYRTKEGKVEYAHTLNGSGLAVGRTWIAILENYQREDGSVEIPEALLPYMGGVKEIS